MSLKELKTKWERAEKAYHAQLNSIGESKIRDYYQDMKLLRKEMEEAAEKEGVALPVMMWPKN